MINTLMHSYDFSTLGENNEYGVPTYTGEVSGSVKMAIFIASQSIQENINYQDCNYVGLTLDKSINDKMVIHYGDQKLKVLYVNPQGRYIQAYLQKQ